MIALITCRSLFVLKVEIVPMFSICLGAGVLFSYTDEFINTLTVVTYIQLLTRRLKLIIVI